MCVFVNDCVTWDDMAPVVRTLAFAEIPTPGPWMQTPLTLGTQLNS